MSEFRKGSEFDIIGTIGEGGGGKIFLAFDKKIERYVAIKEIADGHTLKEKEITLARFIREAKLTGQLEHPNIIPVYEYQKTEIDSQFYVMRYIKGKTLFELLKNCNGPDKGESFKNRLHYLNNFISACEAIAFAHSKGIIHRDLKLSNIIIGEFGETFVIDWGLAKKINEEDSPVVPGLRNQFEDHIKNSNNSDEITRVDAVLGTPSYMSPEQIDRKFGQVDKRSDVYALGTILYALLTGERPYLERGLEVINKIISSNESPSPAERFGDVVPPELIAICEKAMSKKQEDRFNDAGEMLQEIKAYRDGRLVSVYAYSRKELFKRFIARNKPAILATVAVITSVVVGAVISFKYGLEARKAELKAKMALTDITTLSQQGLTIALDSVVNIEKKIKTAPKGKKPEIDKDFLLSSLAVNPLESDFHFWCMDDDGKIVYDEDPDQIGRMLFSDAMYANFPELKIFGERILKEEFGVGYYKFTKGDAENPAYKISAWDTANIGDGKKVRVVVTYPYIAK